MKEEGQLIVAFMKRTLVKYWTSLVVDIYVRQMAEVWTFTKIFFCEKIEDHKISLWFSF